MEQYFTPIVPSVALHNLQASYCGFAWAQCQAPDWQAARDVLTRSLWQLHIDVLQPFCGLLLLTAKSTVRILSVCSWKYTVHAELMIFMRCVSKHLLLLLDTHAGLISWGTHRSEATDVAFSFAYFPLPTAFRSGVACMHLCMFQGLLCVFVWVPHSKF